MQSTLGFFLAANHAKEGLLQVGDSLFNLGLAGKAIIAAITNKVNAASSNRPPQKRLLFLRLLSVNEGGANHFGGGPSHNFWPAEEEEGAKQKLVDI